MFIIGVTGLAGSGKTTFVDTFYDCFPCKINIIKLNFSDELKVIAKIMFHLSDEDVNTQEGKKRYVDDYKLTVRELLQRLGTEICRSIHNDYWINCYTHKINENNPQIVLTGDVRFENEVNYIKSTGGIVVKIVRPELKPETHISENNVLNADYEIINDGSLEDFKNKIRDFHNFLMDI
ncbi:MAG: hypothetical protein WC940_02935 [Candidatus Paceibacterota bacterium]|jgi:hypothetical protein